MIEEEQTYLRPGLEELADKYKDVLGLLGEDVEREGLIKTPMRVAKAMQFLTKGYNEDPEAILRSALFEEDYRQMVVVKDIDFYSLCEHHLLPFVGKAHIAYIPSDNKIIGLSKLARTVEVYARRLQLQEQMTVQIADALMQHLGPKGVMVMVEAEHMCMTMRGIKKPGSKTVTYVARGEFESEKKKIEANYKKMILSDINNYVLPKDVEINLGKKFVNRLNYNHNFGDEYKKELSNLKYIYKIPFYKIKYNKYQILYIIFK